MFSKLLEEFSGSSLSKQALLLATGVGTIAVGAAGVYYVKNRIDNTPPKQWHRAGEINEIYVYPIKSCAPIRMSRVNCVDLGPRRNLLRDRTFAVVNSNGKVVTALQKPKMVLIQPQFDEAYQKMTLSAPDIDDIKIPVNELCEHESLKTVVCDDTVPTVDCGDEVAKWLSTFLLDKADGYRLRFYPLNKTSRKKTNGDTVSLHDEAYMLFNTASVEDLNTRLEQKVTALPFRPNFVVKGPPAYAEDDWRWVKIGNTVFKFTEPCLRCVFINIDPEKGTGSADKQPLKTVKSYRKKPDGVSPAFGIYLGVRQPGEVSLGDPVYYG